MSNFSWFSYILANNYWRLTILHAFLYSVLGACADTRRVAKYRSKYKKSNSLYCTRGISPKLVTSGGAHLRGLEPGNTVANKCHNGGEPFASLCRFVQPGNGTPEHPHR